MKKGKRSTDAEFDRRCTEVQAWILDGHTRHEIIRLGSHWKVSSRQIDDYLAGARDKIYEANSASVKENVAVISRNLWRLYRMALDEGDIGEANKVLMNLAKVKGLDQVTVTNIIDDKREHADKSDEELLDGLEDGD